MQKIFLKRATGLHERELIKETNTKFYKLVIYKNIEPIYGGLYATALLSSHNTEIKTKNGLSLDAANELFNITLKQLNTTN